MGEYPALSEQEIAAIALQLQGMTLESGLSLRGVAISVEHLAT